jgi:hypothetical protein
MIMLLTALRWPLAALALFGAYQGWAAHQRSVGASQAIAEVSQATEKLTNEAVAAREPAYIPGAADRLRKSSCRDCATNVSSNKDSAGVKR